MTIKDTFYDQFERNKETVEENSKLNETLYNDPYKYADLLISRKEPPKALEDLQLKNTTTALFRDDIIHQICSSLTTLKNPNVLLVGDSGVGKTSIVETLADKLYNNDFIETKMLGRSTKIYSLNIEDIIADTYTSNDIENKTKEVLNYIADKNNQAILFIDDIHYLVQSNDSQYKTILNSLKKYVSKNKLRLIATTTTQAVKKMNDDSIWQQNFTNIAVPELSNEQTKHALSEMIPMFETHHKVIIDKKLLDNVILTANSYQRTLNTHKPTSAITILDRACANEKLSFELQKEKSELKTLTQVTALKKETIKKATLSLINTNINLNNITLKDLKNNLNTNIIGQDNAKKAVLKMITSNKLSIESQTKPHSALFAGPTGVGKSELVKQLAKNLFGSKENILYLNMTEYSNEMSLTRLIGSSKGFVGYDSTQPMPFDSLQNNPFQIILLDEFEKAATPVQKLFMQALDEGYITDSQDNIIDFSHSYIIATTNAGANEIKTNSIGFNEQEMTQTNLFDILKQEFPIELLNRFEHVIMFDSITKNQFKDILVLQYNSLVNTAIKNHPKYAKYLSTVDKESDIILELSKKFNPLTNGRPAKKLAKDKIEEILLENIDL